ncbi:CHAT domain-containing protein [Argonema galeatum]|uniref:CHAT domain-containing protein n=1 Tax=Argonema galeatum TaxID=2942762 RepID=UPI0020134112|nr:CHAT domain-containing protein [Argonema galeatum]MCL1468932.1 CHAT domain-containing protein [Argonema galeatum A003/A1]
MGQPPTTPIQSIQQIQTRLREVERETSIKPALLYIVFGRQNLGANAALICPLSETEENRHEQEPFLCDRSPNDTVELIVVTGNNEPISLQIPEATRQKVEALVKEMREEITKTTRDIQPNDYRKSSQELYQLLIARIEPVLKQQGITNLIIVPDVTIRSLPIAALHDGQQFLIEKYSLAIMPSFSLTKPHYVNISNSPILAMGASTFPQSADQKPLPAVSIELATITANTNLSQLFLNQDFTLDNLKTKHSTGNFGIVHLATHAAFEPNDRKNSYIQLWDTKLQLPQMKELEWNNPQIELLVLSACQTAIGDQQAELGFAGLALQAGVKSAVATLWSSDDIGTLALIAEFYQQLKQGRTRAEALRQAQIAILTGRVSIENGNLLLSNGTSIPLQEIAKSNNLKFDHPYYWSAFTVIGNPW